MANILTLWLYWKGMCVVSVCGMTGWVWEAGKIEGLARLNVSEQADPQIYKGQKDKYKKGGAKDKILKKV